MNKGLLFFLILFPAAFCRAQQRPQYSQYIFNNYLFNPALSGIENYTDLKFGLRQQWTGLPDAPRTGFVSAHWALGDEYLWSNPLSFSENGNDPRSRSYQQYYTASPAHHGVGFSAVNDKAGQISQAAFNLSYAYHLQIGGRTNLSVGVAAGISRTAIDLDGLFLENPNDPALGTAGQASLKPDLSAGLWLYGPYFYSGLSVQQLLPVRQSFNRQEWDYRNKQVPHVFFTTGYKLFLSDDINIIPSLMLKYIHPVPLSADLNVKVSIKDKIWIGAGYRKNDGLNMMAGFNVNHFFNLSYAYDMTTSSLSTATNGSHEIVVGLLLNNVYKVFCPQKMW